MDKPETKREYRILPHDTCQGYYGIFTKMPDGNWKNVLPNWVCGSIADAQKTIQLIQEGKFSPL
jgi:hypothetical protein